MSTINGVEKNIERREKEQEKKKSGEKGESKGMQPPQMPQGGGEEEKENGGGGGGEAKNAPQQDPDQYEPEPRSGLTDAKGADAQPAPSDTALNPAGNEPASFLNEPLSAQEMAVIGEGAAGRNNLIDQLNNVDQWDAAAIDRQIPMHSQRTASALKSGAGNAQSAQTTLSSSKASADTTVKNIGGQNKVNESKANQYKERAQQLSDVADSAQVDAPQCTPKPVTFSRPSRGRIDSAKRSHGRFRSQLGQAAAPISGLGGDVAALNASVPHLLDYAGFSAKRGSGNAAAADPAEAWRKEYIRQHNNLRESKQLGEAAEKDAGSALESSESATRDLEQTQQEGQTANQSINQLCEQFNSQLKPLYDKGKAQEKAGQAKQKQGEAEVQAGEALNIASPGAGTSLIRQGSNNIQEGRKLEQDGKKMRQEAVKKAKDLKTQMKQKAQKIKQRVQQTKQRSHQARQPHQHADRSNRGFRVPAYMK